MKNNFRKELKMSKMNKKNLTVHRNGEVFIISAENISTKKRRKMLFLCLLQLCKMFIEKRNGLNSFQVIPDPKMLIR